MEAKNLIISEQIQNKFDSNLKDVVYWINKRIDKIFNWEIKDIDTLFNHVVLNPTEKKIKAWLELKKVLWSDLINYILNIK